ncbi:IPT/TIG domain-containing protein [Longimicrobium sp.]|uniref:IPT/TIG domain-containing protein n=1 Tax=Longimicrobium sp. TaxID=2029185 RepID=UPI002ED891F9
MQLTTTFRRYFPVVLALLLAACGDSGTATNNPTPGISTLEPNQVEQGDTISTLTVIGTDFVRSSVVRFNGSDRTTKFVSSTELHAKLVAADLANAGSAQVLVVNPQPGGGSSNVAQFIIRIRQNPAPSLVALSPAFATAGASPTTVTITGTGFVPESRVYVGNNERPRTYVSPTEMRFQLSDTLLATGGTLVVRVASPAPGGGVSPPLNFEVRFPVPVLASLGTAQTTAGQAGLTVRVNGTGFAPGSVVRVDGVAVATTFVSPTALDATLGEAHLRAAGTLTFTVFNGLPGGGTSGPLALTVVNGVPEVTLLPSRGASAGRSGFTLHVHGRGFVTGSVVRWNGVEVPTQYLASTRLAATIGADAVASPGTAQISVHTPAPGGGTSGTVAFTVRTVGAATVTSRRVVTVTARDLVYNPGTDRLYLSVRGGPASGANTVSEFNPATGALVRSAFVGSDPGRIVRSDDGQFLYVGVDGASAVRRVTLATLTPGMQWPLGGGEVAGDLEVAPGRPQTVAVSRQRPGYSPPLNGVTIYDDGQARPESSPGHTGGNRIEFLESASVLYGYNNAHTGFEFFTMAVDAAGVRHSHTTGGLVSGFYTDIFGEAGRIYGTNGAVVDAERRTRVGTIGGGTAITVDARLGRAFVLADGGIVVYDLNTFQQLGTVPVSGPSLDHPALLVSRLVRAGDDAMAFLDTDELYIIRSPLFGP